MKEQTDADMLKDYLKVTGRLVKGPCREWYEADFERAKNFAMVFEKFRKTGFVINLTGGTLAKQRKGGPMAVDTTMEDIALPRPTDYHLHTDVDEIIEIREGSGEFYYGSPRGAYGNRIKLEPGVLLTIPAYLPHGFKPDGYVMFSLVTLGGKLEPKKELCVHRFDEW